MEGIVLTQGRVQWWAVLNRTLNLVTGNYVKFLVLSNLTFRARLCTNCYKKK
jgi:hypothetical protein